jgi:peroxiredoxin
MRSTIPAPAGRRRLLIGSGIVAAGLAAAAVALALANTFGSGATVRTDRPAAPTVAFRTIDGRDLTLAGLRGQPVALYFMASWCSTCVPEAQAWGQIARDRAEPGLEVFVIDVDPADSPQSLAAFRDGYVGGGLQWVFDANQTLTRAFSVASLDTTVLIDASGRVAFRNTVPMSVDQLRQALANL